MAISKVTLIGLGAMGAYFAPKLEGFLGKGNFRVLAEGERKKRLETKGVTINGTNHKFQIVEPSDKGDTADLIIMAVKDTGLEQAIIDIKEQVGENTQIMCVMNGIESEEKLAKVYGWHHVLYSYMRVSINMKDGVADFDPNWGNVHFGEKSNSELTPRVEAIKALFDAANISYEIDADMVKGMWFKFMCNVGENLTCGLLGVPFGAFHVSEHANVIRRNAMREVMAIAQKLDVDLTEADIERQEATIKHIPFPNKPSTLLDIEEGRKTEIEMFAGKVIELGKTLGVQTPINEVFFHGIKVYEEKNDGQFA